MFYLFEKIKRFFYEKRWFFYIVLLIFILGAIVNSFVSGVGILLKSQIEDIPVLKTENIAISALVDSTKTSGSFGGFLFVQAGRFEEKPVYRMMLQKGNKERYYMLPALTTDIYKYEPGTNTPHIEVVWSVDKNFSIGGRLYRDFDSLDGFTEMEYGEVKSISIYTPKGTVSTDFNIDLK